MSSAVPFGAGSGPQGSLSPSCHVQTISFPGQATSRDRTHLRVCGHGCFPPPGVLTCVQPSLGPAGPFPWFKWTSQALCPSVGWLPARLRALSRLARPFGRELFGGQRSVVKPDTGGPRAVRSEGLPARLLCPCRRAWPGRPQLPGCALAVRGPRRREGPGSRHGLVYGSHPVSVRPDVGDQEGPSGGGDPTAQGVCPADLPSPCRCRD